MLQKEQSGSIVQGWFLRGEVSDMDTSKHIMTGEK